MAQLPTGVERARRRLPWQEAPGTGPEQQVPRIIVADDHPLVLHGIEALLKDRDHRIVGLFSEGLSAWDSIAEDACDIAVLDLNMPGLSGLQILSRARAEGRNVKIVLLTSNISDAQLVEAIRLNVDGLVLKEAAASLLVLCIDTICAGGVWRDRDASNRALAHLASPTAVAPPASTLTERETEVAAFVARGLRNRQIAELAGITEGTVKMHLHNIYEKIGIGSRTELAVYVRDAGVLAPQSS
jgi:two-component system nitrate/nitrite response regulator NarL